MRDGLRMTKERAQLALKAICLCIGLILPMAAHAQSYVATLKSGPLTPSGNGGVPGVTSLTMKLYSSAPFQSGVEGVWNGQFDFSDGQNSLKSLIAAGFQTADGFPVVEVIYNHSGKVTGWFFHSLMENSRSHDLYEVEGGYDIGGSGAVDTCVVLLKTRSVVRSDLGNGLPGRIRP